MFEEWVRRLWGSQTFDTLTNSFEWNQNGSVPYVYFDDSLTFNSITSSNMIVTQQDFDTSTQNNVLIFSEVFAIHYFQK